MHLTEEDIRAAYRLLFGREADPKGLAGYVDAAKAGHLDRVEFIRLMIGSPEYLARNPQSNPAFTVEMDPARLTDALMPHILARLNDVRPWRSTVFVPSPEVYAQPADAPFMPYSTCSGSDFLHPRFGEIVASMGIQNFLHRKLWEFVFVIHHLMESGLVAHGKKGICFGVGKELLPSVFAANGAYITATDAPLDIGVEAGWQSTNQHAAGLAQLPEGKMERAAFERMVEWRECDMNAIDPEFTDYDFCWSACCFEHLGSLRHGMDFVINSVEKTLKPGGVAVHTTEFNLSSNEATIESGPTVIYRHRDIEELVAELRKRGHEVQPFRVAPDMLAVDGYVDLPPYLGPHVKLDIAGHACTSVGLVIRRAA